MNEWYGDMMLWLEQKQPTYFCVTTNGFVKSNGECVMGRGIAKSIADKFPTVPKILGDKIKLYGNIPNIIYTYKNVTIISLPVKRSQMKITNKNLIVTHMQNKFKEGDICPGWALKAEYDIILNSISYIRYNLPIDRFKYICMPRVGCGAGELNWSDIKPKIESLLDDRFYICHWKKE